VLPSSQSRHRFKQSGIFACIRSQKTAFFMKKRAVFRLLDS
jgi:hypothetical protein